MLVLLGLHTLVSHGIINFIQQTNSAERLIPSPPWIFSVFTELLLTSDASRCTSQNVHQGQRLKNEESLREGEPVKGEHFFHILIQNLIVSFVFVAD